MRKYNMLVLTDHSVHKGDNSIYALLRELRAAPSCAGLDVASKGVALNKPFFEGRQTDRLFAVSVDPSFAFTPGGEAFSRQLREVTPGQYDVLFLRIPPPVEPTFWEFLSGIYPPERTINRPNGSLATAFSSQSGPPASSWISAKTAPAASAAA